MTERARRIWTSALLPAVAALASAAAANAPEFVSFPGPLSEVTSPDGVHRVVNIDAANADEVKSLGDNHALIVEIASTGERLWRWSYPRHVTVAWSPRGTHLVVNNHYASNASTCLVFTLGDRTQVDLGQEARARVPWLQAVFQNEHVYVRAVRWATDCAVLVSITGYGEQSPAGFVRCVRFSPASRFEQANLEECQEGR